MRYARFLPFLSCLLSVSPHRSLAQAAPAASVKCTLLPADNSPAAKAFATGDFAQAESLYSASLTAKPAVAAYAGMVDSQIEQNRLTEAIASAQKAAAALPTSGDAAALVGNALARNGQVPEAFAAYAKAMALDGCSARAHFGFGRLSDLVGRHATAAKQLSLAHRLAPADSRIAYAFLETLPPAERAAPLRSFLAEHPQLPPDDLKHADTESALLEQHQTCTETEPGPISKLSLQPVFFDGRFPRSWGLQMNINEQKMPLLELDSSVPGIVLNPRDAEKAGVKPLDGTPAANPGAIYIATANTIRIGDLEFHNCPVTVAPAAALANANSLVGTDFFRQHLIHIDYVEKVLTLSPLPAPAAADASGHSDQVFDPHGEWTQVYVAGPHMILPTLINKQGPFLFAMDTGVTHSIYSPAVTRAQLSAENYPTLNLTGSSDTLVKVLARSAGADTDLADVHGPNGVLLKVERPGKFPTLRFAHSEMGDPTAVTFDLTPLSHQDHIEISGLLGFGLISYYDVQLNYRDALARIVYDQNRRYHVQLADQTH